MTGTMVGNEAQPPNMTSSRIQAKVTCGCSSRRMCLSPWRPHHAKCAGKIPVMMMRLRHCSILEIGTDSRADFGADARIVTHATQQTHNNKRTTKTKKPRVSSPADYIVCLYKRDISMTPHTIRASMHDKPDDDQYEGRDAQQPCEHVFSHDTYLSFFCFFCFFFLYRRRV